jgi:3-oxoacyl-[acyl-carrier protein] reductase
MVGGASSGLGRAAALALAAEGCRLSLAARGASRLAAVADEARHAGAERVLTYPVDLADDRSRDDWVARTVDDLGALHIVVTNGGGPPPGAVDEHTADGYRRAVDTAVIPHIGLALAALPHLRAAGWGRIVIVASETVRQPISGYGLSSTVRPALLGFARSLSQSLGAGDVTVNVLAPGYHDTEGLRGQFGADAAARLAAIGAGVPLGRLGHPADFGGVVAFLASRPATFITGTCLLVDGGATRGIG